MKTNAKQETTVTWEELPTVVTAYFLAHQARDTVSALSAFAADAEVTDEGHTYQGLDQIRGWLNKGGGDYTYITDFVGASSTGEGQLDVVQHLEGDFPGGLVDLHYRFALNSAAITRLVIEP